MKKLVLAIFALVLFTGITADAATAKVFRPRYGVSVYFYDQLRPHGSWLETSDGVVVWKPRIMERSWAPYRMGRWLYTNAGWYWDSVEPFGEVAYHYGRWYNDDELGWVWVPDNVWAPAWVEWRQNDDYVAWVPMSPFALFSYALGLHYSRVYDYRYDLWNYVYISNFCRHNVHNYFLHNELKHDVFNKTVVKTSYRTRDNVVYNEGIGRDVVEKRSGERLTTRDVAFTETRGDVTGKKRDDVLSVYRPTRDNLERERNSTTDFERTERKINVNRDDVDKLRERSVTTNTRTEENNGRGNVVDKDRSRSSEVKTDRTTETRKETTRENVTKSSNTERKVEVNNDRGSSDRGRVKSESRNDSSNRSSNSSGSGRTNSSSGSGRTR